MGAGLQPPDLAPDQFAPALSDLFADQALQDTFDLDAGREGCRLHRRLGFADGQLIIDRQPQADVMDGFAGRNFPAELVALRERLGVQQPCLDFPKSVVAEEAGALDRAAMHQAAGVFLRRRCQASAWDDSSLVGVRAIPSGGGRGCQLPAERAG